MGVGRSFFLYIMNFKVFSVTVSTAACFWIASPARAGLYNFSFSNVEGPVAGSVQGTLVLPDGDGVFSASSLIVTSAPASLGYTLPFNILANFTSVLENAFLVNGGAIDVHQSSFTAYFADGPDGSALSLSGTAFSGTPGSLFNSQLTANVTTGVFNGNNSILVFASASGPAPAPGPVPLLGSLAAFGYSRKLRKKIVSHRINLNMNM
jgi:hypothetical protein